MSSRVSFEVEPLMRLEFSPGPRGESLDIVYTEAKDAQSASRINHTSG